MNTWQSQEFKPFLRIISYIVILCFLFSIGFYAEARENIDTGSGGGGEQELLELRPLDGWPIWLGNEVRSSPTLTDLDGDGALEVIIKDTQFLNVFNSDGTVVAGWPRELYSVIPSPVVADLDPLYPGLEIITPSVDFVWDDNKYYYRIYAFHCDGTMVTGWPQETGRTTFYSSPTIADIDTDGMLEVVIGICDYDKQEIAVYAWHADGTTVVNWPKRLTSAHFPDEMYSSAAIADIDHSYFGLEIIIGVPNGQVYALHADTTLVTGWPQTTNDKVYSSPAIADIDNDGSLEITVGSYDTNLYVWHADGSLVSGWPQETNDSIFPSPAIADIDPSYDGLEIVVGVGYPESGLYSRVYIFHADGSIMTGWPKTHLVNVFNSPVIADLNNDGTFEILISSSTYLYAWYANGRVVEGWPLLLPGGYPYPYSSAAVADLNRDGTLEVVLGHYFDVYAWTLPDIVSKRIPWPMFRKNYQRTGSNTAPILTPIGSKLASIGNKLSFTISATDADQDHLVYYASPLPKGATFDQDTHTFNWIPTLSQARTYYVIFKATDPLGASASEKVYITVSNIKDIEQK